MTPNELGEFLATEFALALLVMGDVTNKVIRDMPQSARMEVLRRLRREVRRFSVYEAEQSAD